MQRVRKGDEVIVTAGKYKRKTGKVLRVINKHSERKGIRLLIEGINLIKKHVKPDPQKEEPGGIKEREAPIHSSNVMLYNPQTQKADKVGIKTLESGKRVRYFKSNGELIDIQ